MCDLLRLFTSETWALVESGCTIPDFEGRQLRFNTVNEKRELVGGNKHLVVTSWETYEQFGTICKLVKHIDKILNLKIRSNRVTLGLSTAYISQNKYHANQTDGDFDLI